MAKNLLKMAKDKYTNGVVLNAKRITMNQVNEAIQKEFPTVFLVKDNGYFFIASDDKEWGLKIAGLYQTSIYTAKLNYQPIERWVEDVRQLINNKTI